jgi:hypothetical protein
MEQRYTFRIRARLFFVPNARTMKKMAYTDKDIDAYILEHKPYDVLMEDVLGYFYNPLCRQDETVNYDPATHTVSATVQILIGPKSHEYTFQGDESNYATQLKYHILDTSFEDGCYGGEDASFYYKGKCMGDFDIREESGITVELIETAPGPTVEEYEALWRADAAESEYTKAAITYSEMKKEFTEYLAITDQAEKRIMEHELCVKYMRKSVYGIVGIYMKIAQSHFYKTAEERLAAFERVMCA